LCLPASWAQIPSSSPCPRISWAYAFSSAWENKFHNHTK
jgi:hypothetical protein